MGGLDSFLGSTRAGASTAAGVGALPEWWFAQQARLGKRIMGGMTELGITPILRGFEGNIPPSLGLKAREAKPPHRSCSWQCRLALWIQLCAHNMLWGVPSVRTLAGRTVSAPAARQSPSSPV